MNELPDWLTTTLDAIPWWVNAGLVFMVGGALVLLLTWAWDVFVVDRYFDRIERETQTGRYRPPSEVEAAAPKWHKPLDDDTPAYLKEDA